MYGYNLIWKNISEGYGLRGSILGCQIYVFESEMDVRRIFELQMSKNLV